MALVIVIVAEMFIGSDSGPGHRIIDAQQVLNVKSMYAAILAVREKLQEVFMETGTTMLLVSHDLEEAVYLADQVLLLTKRPTRVAEILQYDEPRSRTVATLSHARFIAAKKKSLEIFQREPRR